MNIEQAREEIKQRIPCTNYLKKSRYGMFCCPVCSSGQGTHGTGALQYYAETNTYYCHKCHAVGDVIDLIQTEYAADFITAVKIGAEEIGLTIDSRTEEKPLKGKIDHIETHTETQEQPQATETDNSAYYKECQNRINDTAAVLYLKARGISVNTALRAGIGFDPQADPAQSGHKTPRIIIPTSKSHYVGRRIDGGKEFAKINNKGGKPSIFNASALYSGAPFVFVLEGAFDALSLMELGQTAIATNSAANIKQLLTLLEQRPTTAKLIICKDNDSDPTTRQQVDKYAEELEQGLERLGVPYMQADITGTYKDANEALQADKKALEARIDAAITAASQTDIDLFLKDIQTEAYKPAATGIPFFDDLLNGGIVNKTLTIVLAAPAAGKTTLCQQVAEAIAKGGRPVIYINLEMSKEQMLAKSISSLLARQRYYKSTLDILQGYRWNSTDREKITAAAEEYKRNIYPNLQYKGAEEIGSGIDSILTQLEQIGQQASQQGKQAPVIVLDYLHLLNNDTGRNIDTQELLKLAVVGLKQYAIKYNTFVIAISAVNRSSTQGKLTLDSARDSSNIDFTGDYAISLNYEDIDNGTKTPKDIDELQLEKPRRMILRVVKGRFIQSGKSAKVYFDTANNCFFGTDEFYPISDSQNPFKDDETIKRI